MRIETGDEYTWLTDLYDVIGDRFGENIRGDAAEGVCEFIRKILGN